MKPYHYFMNLALKQAFMAKGKTYPNPAVGCVIVQNDTIIGQGYTQNSGDHHAEIMAIQSCTLPLKNCSLYVTLEPCSHYGKTPPCVNRIIKEGFTKVFIGIQDPFHKVCGTGIQQLHNTKIDVVINVMYTEIKEFYTDYFHFVRTGYPLITLKIAESQNGFINNKINSQTKITHTDGKLWSHQLRNRTDALFIGANTLRIDNPSLTPYLIKDYPQSRTDIFIWTQGERPFHSNFIVFDPSRSGKVKIISKKNLSLPPHITQFCFENTTITNIFDLLKKQPYHSILIEGGAWVLRQWLLSSYWNIFYILTSNNSFKKGLSWRKDIPPNNLNFNSHYFEVSTIATFKCDTVVQIKRIE